MSTDQISSDAARSGSRRAAGRAVLTLLAVWIFATGFNFGKAFHIDDAGHLEIAKWISEHPLRPMSGTVFWDAVPEPIHRLNQPPLYFYAMALWGKLFGWTEVSMHCLMAGFSLWAISGAYRLARLIRPDFALITATLLGLSPALIAGQNTMVDVPLLAIWIEFFRLLVDPGVPERKRFLVAALLCSAALLVKYTSVILLPALFLQIVFRRAWKQLPLGLLPVATLMAWSVFNMVEYGGIHLLERPVETLSLPEIFARLAAWVMALGAITPFAFWVFAGWAAAFRKRAIGFMVYAVAGVAAIGLMIALAAPALQLADEWAFLLLRPYFIVSGMGLLLGVAVALGRRVIDGTARHAELLLAYWLCALGTFTVLFAPFMAVRHVLLALPPLLLLVPVKPGFFARRALTWAAVGLSVLLSGTLASADAWYAGIYRRAALEIADEFRASDERGALWFSGHWGWQWYAGQAGMKPLSLNDRPLLGDLVVAPINVDSATGNLQGLELEPVREKVIDREEWVQKYAGPGLYASSIDRLPWTVKTTPIETFSIMRVTGTRP